MKRGRFIKVMSFMFALALVITMVPAKAFAIDQSLDENAEETLPTEQVNNVTDDSMDVVGKAENNSNKEMIEEKLEEAKSLNKGDYTKESFAALTKAIEIGEKVFANESSTQVDIDNAVETLDKAMKGLVEKAKGKLDIGKLEDGTYILHGDMVKIDKKANSMANNAFNHNVKLTVKNGEYYITLDFKGMKIGDKFGYLGTLKYFLSGYTTDKFGRPVGELRTAKIKSLQRDGKGNIIKDDLGTNYPDIVEFKLISEAIEDGYVPLQVFVPIMDNISSGLGNQEVYLKLNWNTIEKTTEGDDRFIPKKDNNQVVSLGNKPNNNLGNKTGNSMEKPPVVASNVNNIAPATGDTNSILPWMVLVAVAGTAIFAVRKKEN